MSESDDGCKGPHLLVPVIDRDRCEAKADCLRVCPYDVFALGTLDARARAGLSLKGRIKGFFHRYQQAFVARAEACQACGLCVTACPERAIKLAAPPAP